jgi:transcriptional regulator of aromatic amino acid metabolism
MLTHLLTCFDAFFGYQPFVLLVTIISFCLKAFILVRLLKAGSQSTTTKYSWFFLLYVLICSMIGDSAWCLSLIKTLWLPTLDYRIYIFWVRIAWVAFAIQYQALALFIDNLVDQSARYTLRQKIFMLITGAFSLFSTLLALIDINCQNAESRPALEVLVRTIESSYLIFILLPTSIFIVLWKMRTALLPLLLRQQLRIIMPALIIPIWLLDILQAFPLAFSPSWTTNSYSAVNLSTIVITCTFFYCARKVVSLRFLNFHTQVQSSARFNFIDGFKDVLEQLGHATSAAELRHITQTLFKEAFDIPLSKTKLYVRKLVDTEKTSAAEMQSEQRITGIVEGFLSSQPDETLKYIAASKILVLDEISFSNFYEKTTATQTIVTFLESLDADIFLPIYEKQNIIAYIIVERQARPGKFYGNVEHDEMLVFSSYLGNIINLLQNRNLKMLLRQEKELREELYHKHQEINQYKESIRSFLRNSHQKEIGILFYKNRHFVFGNKAAKELIQINANTQEGHPIAKALKSVARHVQEYKAAYSCFAQDKEGNRIVLAGVPNLENNNVIITIYYPEISDIIKKQLDMLQDPSNWDYLLYLETTSSGKLISQLIPGSGEKLLQFKIELLQCALSKKALLLEMAEEDLLPTVEILHHISLRETLHVLKLQSPSRTHETATKIFGINPIFSTGPTPKPLLDQLNVTGTLFIQNIHFLDLETQEYLAEFLKFGLYRIFKSDQKMVSSARIICSTNQNLTTLAQEGAFSKNLLIELKKTTLSMPSLLTLPEDELSMLTDGFIEQIVKTQDLKNLLELNNKEKERLSQQRPLSLQELKNRVQALVTNKSKKNQIYKETQFDPAYQLSDQHLVEASRLGKRALKDPKVMAMLWEKFKSQTKIATFLGVNRSSVNRRIRDFKGEQPPS